MKRLNSISMAVMSALAGYAMAALACHITPLELLQRPIWKSAPLTKTQSSASQFAGRTTLSSGSASFTVSTAIVNSDSLIGLNVQCAVPAAYIQAGRISVLSGVATGVVSTSAVYSASLILHGVGNAVAVASGTPQPQFRVNSIVDGVSFNLTTVDSIGPRTGPNDIMWSIPTSVLQGISVRTISPGGFFTVGWNDNIARPIDSTIMWELRRST